MKRKVTFQFNDKIYSVNVERSGNEIIIEHNGEIYKINLIDEDKKEKKAEPITTRSELSISLTPTSGNLSNIEKDKSGLLLAPMTGVVNEIKVKKGQNVKKGDTVIVLEAMKMYVDIHAPISGTIEEIFVKQNENVSINQKLLKIE